MNETAKARANVAAMLQTIHNFLQLATKLERDLLKAELRELTEGRLLDDIAPVLPRREEGPTHSGICVGPRCDVVD